MRMFEHHSLQGNEDRQIDYNVGVIHSSSTLCWHYWLTWLGLVRSGKRSSCSILSRFKPITHVSHAHQRLRPILPHTCILLSSHYGMISATVTDLYSCMSESDRQNGRKVPLPPSRVRKPQLWISTRKSDPFKLIVLV